MNDSVQAKVLVDRRNNADKRLCPLMGKDCDQRCLNFEHAKTWPSLVKGHHHVSEPGCTYFSDREINTQQEDPPNMFIAKPNKTVKIKRQ